ncbi:MAG TPA: HAD-IB family phosphatase [Actinomycetota bacterium]|nr:HAD-IB family phosphatase [Actinomycetota bacterium]
MSPVRALVVDFDGTACLQDVSEELLKAFGEPSWPQFDDAVDRGEMGLREAAGHQAAMLSGSLEEMLAYALAHAELDPTFPRFVAWAETRDLPLALVSDGFAFYIRPILEDAGLGHLEVVTNELAFDGGRPQLRHPNGHPECVGCGTCKMLAVQRFQASHGPVAFVGEGQSDRYGALYADVVFAKLSLVPICEADGVPFRPWEDFDDVIRVLETLERPPGPVAPVRCPGWTPAASPTA